jgi:hypothetical protein
MGQHAYSGSFDMSSQANYQALMGFIDAAIQADGWTLTADTGQTDPAGAALPAQNAATIFRLYQSPGALTPVYVKLSFQRNASNFPQIGVQVGTSTNGTGTLGGITTTAKTLPCNSTGTKQAYVSGNLGWLNISLQPDGGGGAAQFFLDRSVDSTETYTSDYITQVTVGNGVSPRQETKVLAGGTQSGEMSRIVGPNPQLVAGDQTSWIIGTFLSIPLMLPVVPGGAAQHSPNVGIWSIAAADFTPNTLTIVQVYGTPHTYLVTNITGNAVGGFTISGMFRYE